MLKEEGLPVVKSVLIENPKSVTEEFLDSIRTQVLESNLFFKLLLLLDWISLHSETKQRKFLYRS